MSSNIHLHFLCSGADARKILDSLWNFIMTKKFKNLDSIPPIPEICCFLEKEFSKSQMNRTALCASTHMVFATVNLYKEQTNKLYNQTKATLDNCIRTFYNDKWIDTNCPQFVYDDDDDESQHVVPSIESDYEQTSKLRNKKKASKAKVIKKEKKTSKSGNSLFDQLNLIDQVFVIDDDDEEAEPAEEQSTKRGARNKKNKSVNSTTNNPAGSRTVRMSEITMIDKVDLEVKFNKGFDNAAADDAFADFDDDFIGELETVFLNKQIEAALEVDQEVPELEQPDYPMSTPQQEQLQSFQNELIDVIKDHATPRRKRHSSLSIESRVNAKIPRIEEEESQRNDDFQGIVEEDLVPNVVATPKINPIILPVKVAAPKRKTRAAMRRKLIIDKKCQIEKNFPNPTPHFESPIDNFHKFLEQQKYTIDKLFAAPSSRAKGNIVQSIFKRSLKIVPQCFQEKLRFNEAGDPVSSISPPRKRRVEFENEHSFIRKKQKVNSVVEPNQEPENEIVDMNNNADVEIQGAPEEILPNFICHDDHQSNFNDLGSANSFPSAEVDESNSGEVSIRVELMMKLKRLWNQQDDPITMNELSFGLTVITAARIFLELMVLSKFEAVELIQGDRLEIADIKAGKHIRADILYAI